MVIYGIVWMKNSFLGVGSTWADICQSQDFTIYILSTCRLDVWLDRPLWRLVLRGRWMDDVIWSPAPTHSLHREEATEEWETESNVNSSLTTWHGQDGDIGQIYKTILIFSVQECIHYVEGYQWDKLMSFFPRCYRPLYLQYISHGAGWDESIIDFCSDILMFKNVSIVWLLQDGTVIFVALFLTFTNACHSVISCGWDKLIIYFCSAICVHHMAWARWCHGINLYFCAVLLWREVLL